MTPTSPPAIVVEASPLISLLKIDRFDLLSVFESPLLCLNHVRDEVKYFGQAEKLSALISGGSISEVALVELPHISAFESLRTSRPSLGSGECASIIYAQANQVPLVITDKTAKNEAKRRGIACITTEEVVVLNIREGILTVSEADALIGVWKSVREGVTHATSFAELLD